MKNVLVTGGSGLLGNNIIRELIKAGFSVTAAVRASSSRKSFADVDAQIMEVDFLDDESVCSALNDVDTVIHSAGFIWFGWKKLEQSRLVNVGITSRIAKACLERDIRFVHVSSLDTLPIGSNKEVLDEESLENRAQWNEKVQCNYVVSKTEADQALKILFSQGLSGCIVHPGMMLGPYDWKPSSGELIQSICRLGVLFSCPTGGASVTDVRDVARATITAAGKPETTGKHYILAGHNMSYRELCNRIADKCGKAHAWGRTGPIAYALAAIIGGVSGMLGQETIINTAAVRMARLWHYYSSERAISELDYQLRDLDETLDDAINWLAGQQMIEIQPKQSS